MLKLISPFLDFIKQLNKFSPEEEEEENDAEERAVDLQEPNGNLDPLAGHSIIGSVAQRCFQIIRQLMERDGPLNPQLENPLPPV